MFTEKLGVRAATPTAYGLGDALSSVRGHGGAREEAEDEPQRKPKRKPEKKSKRNRGGSPRATGEETREEAHEEPERNRRGNRRGYPRGSPRGTVGRETDARAPAGAGCATFMLSLVCRGLMEASPPGDAAPILLLSFEDGARSALATRLGRAGLAFEAVEPTWSRVQACLLYTSDAADE